MIYLSLLYWLVLLLPGYTGLRLFMPRLVKSGPLGTIALSLLATFALLTPINIIGHTFRLPLAVLTGSIVVLVIGSIVVIIMNKWWRDIGRLLLAGVCVETLVIAVHFVLAARHGTILEGDAHTHLSRIRMLLDEGLLNGHPFYGGKFFFPTYHTNLWHAIFASGAQLFGLRAHDMWWTALPVAGLLIAGSIWQLTWTVFQRAWPAWAAALFAVGTYGSVPFLVYPNKVAPLWVLPLVLAFVIDAIREPKQWKPIVLIAAAVLVLGQVHGLYTVFAVLVAVPVLSVVLIGNAMRRQWRVALFRALAIGAVMIGLAFPLYSAWRSDVLESRITALAEPQEGEAAQSPTPTSTTAATVAKPASQFGRGFTGKWWRMPFVLSIGILCAIVLKSSRTAVVVLLGFFLCTGAWLWLPFLYQPLSDALGEDWVIARMGIVFRIIFFAIVTGGITALLDFGIQKLPADLPIKRIAPWRIASLAAVWIGATLFAPKELYGWKTFRETAQTDAEVRRERLDSLRTLEDFARTNIPADAVILAPPALGMIFTSLTDCEVIYAYMSNFGAENRALRELDRAVMLRDSTLTSERNTLLRQYNVSCVVLLGNPPLWVRRDAVSSETVEVPLLDLPVSIHRLPEHDQ